MTRKEVSYTCYSQENYKPIMIMTTVVQHLCGLQHEGVYIWYERAEHNVWLELKQAASHDIIIMVSTDSIWYKECH